MEPKVRQKLEEKFKIDAVKQRKGAFGKTINYVDGASVIDRLNAAFDSDWSFAILEHRLLGTTHEVLVRGRLSALGLEKEAFGKSSPAVSRDTGEIVSEGDAYKSAATDCLKKCATLFGVGLHLFANDEPLEADEPKQAFPRSVAPPSPKLPTSDRLTARQLSTIWSMARRLGHDADAIRAKCREVYGVMPEQLGKADASTLIAELAAALDGKRGAA
jgi:hypothetical protein